MLVLSRKDTEAILIGDDIRVTLIKSQSGQARIGIDAPRSVIIVREELTRNHEEETTPERDTA